MKNSRKQPQRVPPPLLGGNERIDGQGILDEVPGDAGLVLWKTFRGIGLWTQLSTDERRQLVSPETHQARVRLIRSAEGVDEIRPALLGLAEMYERPITRTMVVARCRAVERWADARQAPRTALEFGQLAALAAPRDAAVAVGVAKRGRDLAEYARAESWYWQAIVRARRSRNWEAYVYSMLGLGVTHRLKGNYPAARRNMERGLRRARRQGLRQQEAMAFHELMVVAIHTNSLARTLQYGRKALESYGPEHSRVPWLAHDLAVFWMNRGYFEHALDVFMATPADIGAPHEQMLRYASIARAAGALGEKNLFAWASRWTHLLMSDPRSVAAAVVALMEYARGALSIGELDSATEATQRALALAADRGEGERLLEAEALLEEIHSAGSLRRLVPAPAPREVEEFTSELVECLAAATPIPA